MNQKQLTPGKVTLPMAIARQEGFYVSGTRAARNHNPGNIVAGHFTTEHGATGSDGRFAIFPDDATGMACLTALLKTKFYFDCTIHDAISHYAPSNENDTEAYVLNVCKWVGCRPSDLVMEHV